MQGKGYWLDPDTGEGHLVTRHELWLMNKENANKVGIPEPVFAQISAMDPTVDMNAIRMAACKAGLIRLRDQGNQWGVEFWCYPSRVKNYLWSTIEFLAKLKIWVDTPVIIRNLYNMDEQRRTFADWQDSLRDDNLGMREGLSFEARLRKAFLLD